MSEIPPPFQDPSSYSNYPRENPYQRPPGVYFDAIGQSWNLVKQNLGTWVLAILIFSVLFGGYEFAFISQTGGLNRSQPPNPANFLAFAPIGLIFGILSNVLLAGYFYMGVKQARNEKIELADIFFGFKKPLQIIAGAFLTGIVTVVGTCLCIVPGLYLSGLLLFVPLLILDRNLGPVEAMQECWDKLKPHAWSIFALMFVTGLLAELGACLACVGILFTLPIYFVTMGITYNSFFPRESPNAAYQPIGYEPPR